MVTASEVLAIIPARGGSKSIPHKNIKTLGGEPLIAYSIAAGQQARTVTRLIVSTDDGQIADVARSYQAEVPFLRPAELSEDSTLDLPVFQHALTWLEVNEGYRPDVVVQLRPTSPFRPADCVDRAVEILLDNPKADSVRAVVPSGENPYKMWRLSAEGPLEPLLRGEFAEPYNEPRQKLPPTYWQTGHVDVMRYGTLMRQHSMTGKVIYPLIMDAAYAVDIDTPLDWEYAEWALARKHFEPVRPSARQSAPAPLTSRELADVRLLVLDFDGVLTDNRVLVNQDRTEAVWCHRGDGWGIARLKEAGVEVIVLSTEANSVVAARCWKLGIECVQACNDKFSKLQEITHRRALGPERVAYVGNDVNDLECLRWVGLPIAVADAETEVIAAARLVTSRPGGHGAVREVADAVLQAGRAKNELSLMKG